MSAVSETEGSCQLNDDTQRVQVPLESVHRAPSRDLANPCKAQAFSVKLQHPSKTIGAQKTT